MSTARSILLSAVVLLPVAFGAGWLGSQMGAPEPAPVENEEAPTAQISRLTRYMEELDRRLQVLEQYRQGADDRWTTTGNQLNELATRVDALERRPAAQAPTTAPETVDTVENPGAKQGEADALADIQEAMARRVADTARSLLPHRLKLFADTTAEGAAARSTQARIEGRAAATNFGGDPDSMADAFDAFMQRAATEIGPLVGDGIESADLGLVKERYTKLLEDLEKDVAGVLEEEEDRKRWTDAQSARRRQVAAAIDFYSAKQR